MENQHRRLSARTMRQRDKENSSYKKYLTPNERQALSVRGALEDLTLNVLPQRELNTGQKAVAGADFEKRVSSHRKYARSNYKHVQAKVDTGLAKKCITPSSQPPPMREESKRGLAAAIKDDPNNQMEINESKNGKCEKKYINIHSPPRLPENIEDIDGDDNNPLVIPMYIKDVYKYLKELEEQYPIECDHLRKQTVVTGKMRATLLDWLLAVRKQFSLLLETFHLTVGIIDRYLQAVPNIRITKLQLVGITAMFIACKYEEIYSPRLADFIYISKDLYSKSEVLQCETDILMKLGFCLSWPLPLSFLRRFGKAAHGKYKHLHLAKYLVDLSLIEYSMAYYKPSELAAAAICLSLHLQSLEKLSNVWTPTLSYYSEYTINHIEPIVRKIAKIVVNLDKSNYRELYVKYLKDKDSTDN